MTQSGQTVKPMFAVTIGGRGGAAVIHLRHRELETSHAAAGCEPPERGWRISAPRIVNDLKSFAAA
jgi:hypothetical protein